MSVAPYYISRESSWLDFNERVLEEAYDEHNPLLERLRFLSITASNLDEFFMVRVAELKNLREDEPDFVDATGMTARERYAHLVDKAHAMYRHQYDCWEVIYHELREAGIRICGITGLSNSQIRKLGDIFEERIYPVLTPIGIDNTRPFPLLNNKSIYVAVLLKPRAGERANIAAIQAPPILERFIALEDGVLVPLEDVIAWQAGIFFEGYDVEETCPIRITRDSDLEIDEETTDLMLEMERSISRRKWGAPVRLELYASGQVSRIRERLMESLEMEEECLYYAKGPLDLAALGRLTRLEGYSHLLYEPRPPMPAADFDADEDMFEAILQRDRLIFMPYESFDCVVEFLKRAARDPGVLAIKQTLYRVSGNSPVVAALMEAAGNGKQVTVLVELKARFDEENNINWARRLEQAGCHVIYGLARLKTHCKVLLVVRREGDGIRRYVHLGTGNYNENTARLYTDMGLFTCKEQMGADASTLFNMLTGYAIPQAWKKLAVAPTHLRDFFNDKIDAEIENARLGRACGIWAKMNSLIDDKIIERLYRASTAGVPVRLIVRGMCSLLAGVPGVSENITVRSIVGRNLEHSRIFRFENGGRPQVYMGSADWMPRNLDRRIEVVFPVEDDELSARVWGILQTEFADNVKAREQGMAGRYVRVSNSPGQAALSAQDAFYDQAKQAARQREDIKRPGVFKPQFSPQE